MDNIFTVASSYEEMQGFKAMLESKWEVSDLRPAKFTLDITISHDCPSHTIRLSQIAYINCLIS
jgi:hypothetical protein